MAYLRTALICKNRFLVEGLFEGDLFGGGGLFEGDLFGGRGLFEEGFIRR